MGEHFPDRSATHGSEASWAIVRERSVVSLRQLFEFVDWFRSRGFRDSCAFVFRSLFVLY